MNKKILIGLCAVLVLLLPGVSKAQGNLNLKYSAEIHTGYGTTTKVQGNDMYIGRVMLGTIHGVSFDKYGEIGVGFDAVMLTHYYKSEGLRFAANPYVSVRPTYPITEKFSVFLDCALGATIPVVNMENSKTDVSYMIGPGIKYRKLNLSVGFNQIGSGSGSTSFFERLGLYL